MLDFNFPFRGASNGAEDMREPISDLLFRLYDAMHDEYKCFDDFIWPDFRGPMEAQFRDEFGQFLVAELLGLQAPF